MHNQRLCFIDTIIFKSVEVLDLMNVHACDMMNLRPSLLIKYFNRCIILRETAELYDEADDLCLICFIDVIV
jgi:hypothetical protein